MGDAEGAFTGEGSPPAAISQVGAVANNSIDKSHVTIMNNNGCHQVHVSIHFHHHGQQPEGTGQEPEGTGQEPEGTEQEPGGTEQEPEGTEQEPEGNEQEPGGTEQEPEGTEQEPEGT